MSVSYKYSHIFFTLVFILIIVVFYKMMKPFLVVVILALTLVSLFYPNYRHLKGKLKGRAGLSSLIMCTIITFLIIIPSFIFFLALFDELNAAYNSFRSTLDHQPPQEQYLSDRPLLRKAWEQLNHYLGVNSSNLRDTFSRVGDRIIGYLLDNYSSILGSIGVFISNFFIMVFCMFFFFRDGHTLLEEMKRLVPLAPEYEEMVVEKLRQVIYATFFGIFATAACQGISAGIIFMILGINNPVLWGTATAIFSLVPVVGTAVVGLYLIFTGSAVKGVILLTLGALVIGLVDNLVRPLIIEARSEGMHVLLVFFSLAGGLALFGPPGLVLGPLVAALVVTFLEIYKIEFREELDHR
jgi:predicted PurR-regulated permease PerM